MSFQLFKTLDKLLKSNYSFNASKWRRMALSCSKKVIYIIKWNNIKHDGDFYCLYFLHSFRTKYKIEAHKKISENCFQCLLYGYLMVLKISIMCREVKTTLKKIVNNPL